MIPSFLATLFLAWWVDIADISPLFSPNRVKIDWDQVLMTTWGVFNKHMKWNSYNGGEIMKTDKVYIIFPLTLLFGLIIGSLIESKMILSVVFFAFLLGFFGLMESLTVKIKEWKKYGNYT